MHLDVAPCFRGRVSVLKGVARKVLVMVVVVGKGGIRCKGGGGVRGSGWRREICKCYEARDWRRMDKQRGAGPRAGSGGDPHL